MPQIRHVKLNMYWKPIVLMYISSKYRRTLYICSFRIILQMRSQLFYNCRHEKGVEYYRIIYTQPGLHVSLASPKIITIASRSLHAKAKIVIWEKEKYRNNLLKRNTAIFLYRFESFRTNWCKNGKNKEKYFMII